MVSYPHFKVVFGCKMESVTLKRWDFRVKVGVMNKLWITMWISFDWLWITYKNVDKTIFRFIRYNLNICSSMFCSNSPDLILSNVCSIINPTVKLRNTVYLWCMVVAKTKKITRKCSRAYSWFIHRPSSKFYLVDILKIPNKIKQNPKSSSSNHLSYPISLKPTKIKNFSHFQTQKSNFHLAKNPSTIPKTSLFISTFHDNDFPSKNSKSYYQY